MKKVLIIIMILLLLMPTIKAADYNSNMTGITVTPSKNSGDESCNSSNYWIGATQAPYKFQGLRISFYDEKGKQVGNTFDSWDWGKYYEQNYLSKTKFDSYNSDHDEKLTVKKIDTILEIVNNVEAEYEKVKELNKIESSHESYIKIQTEYNKIKDYSLLVVKYVELLGKNGSKDFLDQKTIAKLKEVVDEGKYIKKVIEQLKLKSKIETATANGFTVYLQKTNHSLNYYSKVDYLKKGITEANAKHFKEKDMLDGGYYVYYHDTISHATNTYKGTEVFGNLIYSSQDATKKELRTYLTTESVMKRYLKMAGANNLVDIKEGNYTMLIEPVVSIGACIGGTYSGRYTSTDFGYILSIADAGVNISLRQFPGWLKIERDINISGINFKVADPAIYPAKHYYKPEEILSTLGTGMSAILGTEVCGDKCVSSKRYPIVYRTFDLNNPFLNKDGSIRDLSEKSNWYDKTDTIETDIYSKGPFLTIILDPATIKQIRDDNKKINYSNLNNNTCSVFRNKYKSIFNPNIDFCNE